MSARSVNKVILIGNLTRDVDLRYTPQGNAVASFGLATNREWKIEGSVKEATDFHNIVAWNKLAELCSQLLVKGSKIYVEGRLQTRNWEDSSDGSKKYKTEVVINEMIVLYNKKSATEGEEASSEDHAPTIDSNDLSDFDALLEGTDLSDKE